MITAPKHGSRDSRKATVFVAATVCLSVAQGAPAWADYEDAKAHFNGLDANSRQLIGLGLIGTGDFRGLLDFGFTKRLYQALIRFQLREGFVPDGELDDAEFDRLKSLSMEFYDPLGLRYYDHPDAPSQLFVPRLAFDTETRTRRGLAFERNDKSLSLSFVAYPSEEKTFSQLYNSMTKTTSQRKVVYKKRLDRYFVSTGVYRGRRYYTWISSTLSGPTGFTLSWTSSSDDLGSKLSIVLANRFMPGGSARQQAGQAQEEVPQSMIDNGDSTEGDVPRKPDDESETTDNGTNSAEDTAASHDSPEDPVLTNLEDSTAPVDGESNIPSEYWQKPLMPRTVEIKGYEFAFTPTGNGEAGRVRGVGYFTRSHTGRYEVLQNEPGKFSIKVNIGDDDPAHTNTINAMVEIRNGSATLTGTIREQEIGQLTETVRGDGSKFQPYFIKFSRGSLKWCLPN